MPIEDYNSMARESQWQELEAAGHTTSTAKTMEK